MELWDIYDIDRVRTGRVAQRGKPASEGGLGEGEYHLVVHICVFNGRGQLLLQQRQKDKEGYPNLWDVSAAGSALAGENSAAAASRELREELGVTAAPADLHECGLRRFRFEAEFHGKPFKDNQVSKVFCLWLDREAEDFAVQKSEIDYVKWFDLDEAVAAVEQGTIPNCIFPEELGMVKKFVGQTGGGC